MTYTSVDQVAPGRPNEILRAAGELARLASNLEDAERRMRDLVDGVSNGNDILQGAAANAFASKFSDLPPSLGDVSEASRSLARAISRWGNEVDGLRAEAKRALDRYQAQKRRRDTAQGQVNAVAARLSRLRAQVGAAESQERGHLRDHHRESWTGQQAAADASYRQYQEAFRNRRRLEHQRNDAAEQKRRHEATVDSADSEMRSAQRELQRILDRHRERDRVAADAIERALPPSLRNKGWLEKAADFVVDQIDKLGDWLVELASTIDAMVEAALEGDWEKAVFRFRELVDQLTPVVTALITALSVVALFIPVPGLNLLMAAALTLAVARFASTGFLLATDADDPDHPGKKAASFGELVGDGINVIAAAATMGKGAPKPKPGAWETGAKSLLSKQQSGNILKRTAENVARPIAKQMVKHPVATRLAENVIYEKAIKPRVEAKMDAVKEWGTERVIDEIGARTGVDPKLIRTEFDKVVDLGESVLQVKEGLDWTQETEKKDIPKSSAGRLKDVLDTGKSTGEGLQGIYEYASDAAGFDSLATLVDDGEKMVSGLVCSVPSTGKR